LHATATFDAGTSHDAPASNGEVMRIASEIFGYGEPEEPAAARRKRFNP